METRAAAETGTGTEAGTETRTGVKGGTGTRMDRRGGRKKSSHNPLKKRCRGDTENGRECCRNRKYRRNNIDTADADLDQQGDNKEAERGARDVGSCQRHLKRISFDASHQRFPWQQ